ncbi:hypothetical protein [Streptomyces xanthochromogenes]
MSEPTALVAATRFSVPAVNRSPRTIALGSSTPIMPTMTIVTSNSVRVNPNSVRRLARWVLMTASTPA